MTEGEESEPDRFRREAARCRARAEASATGATGREWLSLARSYAELAEAAEAIEASVSLTRPSSPARNG